MVAEDETRNEGREIRRSKAMERSRSRSGVCTGYRSASGASEGIPIKMSHGLSSRRGGWFWQENSKSK